MPNFKKVLNTDIQFEVLTKVIPTKGNLVYEYNPFRNYRLSQDKYLYQGGYYSEEELESKFGITKPGNTWKKGDTELTSNLPELYEKGQLVDFITDELNFSLEHPVHIIPQPSYDGSVNLILNDGINTPRLINSRFSATGKNTYEVVDRKGNNDTNIYDSGNQFDIDTSLYKRVVKIPKIKFIDVQAGGNLKVGNYHFYFKLSDADGNETDFVGESGLVSVFLGFGDPQSVTTGQKNENSYKQVYFQIKNIDSSYNYVTVYYSRSTSEGSENFITEYVKIEKLFPVNNASIANVIITGYEDTTPITATDINLFYNVVDSVTTSATCQNMLFLANVHKPDIPYEELADLSLRFLPYLKEEPYPVDMDKDYTVSTNTVGYIDPKFIYEKTGYWGNELYRLGVVYILNNGELSRVFNIRGGYNIGNSKTSSYTNIEVFKRDNNGNKTTEREYISYDEERYTILSEGAKFFENVKGVVSFSPTQDKDTIYSIEIKADEDTINELKKHVKGYFFVRQTRIPTILAQGLTIGIDKEAHTPTLPTKGGILDELEPTLDKTHVTTDGLAVIDTNDINFISEGFLSRYTFEFKAKKSGLFGDILKAAAITVGVVALAAGTVFSGGVLLGTVATIKGAIAATAVVTATVGVAAGAAAGAITATAGIIQNLKYGIDRAFNRRKFDGRNTKAPAGMEIKETENSRKLTHEFRDRIIIKDPKDNYVSGIICPDYSINQAYYNSIFTGNTHLIESTVAQNKYNYLTNEDRHFYVQEYYDNPTKVSKLAKVIGVPDSVKCVGLGDMLFRSCAGSAEEAWRYESIAEDFKSAKSKATGEMDSKTINNQKINSDIIRGCFSPYLAFDDENNTFNPAQVVNIYIPEYSKSNMQDYFYIRMIDHSPFMAISDRFDIHESNNSILQETSGAGVTHVVYRGDCYICQYTQRIFRNFNDPSAPYNDDIVDEKSWKDNYDPENSEKYAKINLGDVNAIQLGMWVTFRLRSSNNLNIRTLDGSSVNECAMIGHSKGYYPYHPMSTEGTYKHDESQVYNRGFSKSVSERWNVEVPDVPHIKNWFKTRIMYSDIHINDAYKNGYRVFQGTNYRDYTREYGEIVKLISFESSLLCVFERGVALIPVNERAVAGQSQGGNVYINTSNVLPENPKIISDMYGSQWAESILKVPGTGTQYVYGVDTVAKKIWRTDGNTLECISDFKVQEFLNNNITLGERELTPKIGIRNVKTHYNAYKRDVMFTFYDNTYGFEEKVWNLCWNEILEKFITFYSWVPSYMENINNIPFSFNRDTSKWIAKLGTSHADNSFSDGITLTSTIMDEPKLSIEVPYITKEGAITTTKFTVSEPETEYSIIGLLGISNRILPIESAFYKIDYALERDIYGNYKDFDIYPVGNISLPVDAKYSGQTIPIYALGYSGGVSKFYSELYYRNSKENAYADTNNNRIDYLTAKLNQDGTEQKDANGNIIRYGIDGIKNLPIFKDITGKRVNLPREKQLNPDKIVRLLNIKATITIVNNTSDSMPDDYHNMKAGYASGTTLIDAGYYESTVAVIPKWNMQFLSTDFWKHGQAGIIDIADDLKPTYWYGKQHPFEFECVVVNDPSVHKIFTNLELSANKAKPESFHYEIVGECYDFAKDKVNMFFRQEAIKSIWQYNGADICYDRNYLKVQPNQQFKSADLPHKYYTRQDTINEIEDYYISIGNSSGKVGSHDYRHLSGAEIVYYPTRQEYRIWNHARAVSLDDLNQDDSRSIITANCKYLEDTWKITINPILVCYKNEQQLTQENGIYEYKSTWTSPNKPKLPVMNSPIPDEVRTEDNIEFPPELIGRGYTQYDIDLNNWLNDISIYQTSFGEAQNRREVDIKDKFMKVRIRYSGEELAIINFLNTIYKISYA